MSHLIHDFYFFHKIYDVFLGQALSSKLFDCDTGAHPLGFVNFAVASGSDAVLLVKNELLNVYIRRESMVLERFDKVLICILVQKWHDLFILTTQPVTFLPIATILILTKIVKTI